MVYVLYLLNPETNFIEAKAPATLQHLIPVEVCHTTEKTTSRIAEAMWLRHNKDDRPYGRAIRSMSVGDVVVIFDEDEHNRPDERFTFLQVDALGWCTFPPSQWLQQVATAILVGRYGGHLIVSGLFGMGHPL